MGIICKIKKELLARIIGKFILYLSLMKNRNQTLTQLVLDIHKAIGSDGMPAHLLKETCEEIALSLTFIFQASMQQYTLDSNVLPLFYKKKR